ncbi:DUF3267 domain-containing protein [Sporosarcina sp. YIM B06819]|uniref:DUF3267 domain-containing protein n=1 Tax=Sporosarcina sp. YIM B06819 TaxID=3081769 RepID=UPI00298CDB59|nr:DUF3267 domain-containing protein [Sporosarcina sp. YIM B06819]
MLNELPEPDKIILIDLPKVAKTSLLITIGTLLLLWAAHIVIEQQFSFSISIWSVIWFIIGYIVLIVLHELFHLLGFRLFGNVPWKSMIVGINLKLGVAYATTDKLMTNHAIRKALLLPFWMTGVMPAIIGLAIGNGLLIGLSALLIGGAAGDFAMYKELRKLPDDWLVKDDPELPQLYVFATDTLDK